MKIITLPGLIDPHVHLRDPGQTNKEDFTTGTSAALSGGFTTVLDMPNNKIPITTVEQLIQKRENAAKKVVCDIGFYFGSLGDNLEEFKKLTDLVFGLKLYLNETTGNFLISKENVETIFASWNIDKPILLHAEDDAVAAVIKIVRKTGKQAHFCHISTSLDLAQIIQAKHERLPITCGVTPHHLFLTESDAGKLGPFGKMKPPLRSKKEQDYLWKNLSYIDVVESDHAPHTILEKQSAIPPFGVSGLETTLPLLLSAVLENRLTMADVSRLCHKGPASLFGVPINPQTKVEVDLDEEYIIDNNKLMSKCKWSPFNGRKVRGKVQSVYIRGEKVFTQGQVLVQPGFGKVLP